ncbi:hypothetical protein Tco_0684212 [Tanacetum coccineum]
MCTDNSTPIATLNAATILHEFTRGSDTNCGYQKPLVNSWRIVAALRVAISVELSVHTDRSAYTDPSTLIATLNVATILHEFTRGSDTN